MICLKDVCKTYWMGTEAVHALDHASMEISQGEYVSIVGPSGSGKSTMMNIIGCLDLPDEGEYLLDGQPIQGYTEKELARIRNCLLYTSPSPRDTPDESVANRADRKLRIKDGQVSEVAI